MPIIALHGSGHARAVLFVHGTPGDHRYFQKLAALAPADVAVPIIDLPDHGSASDETVLDLSPFERDVVTAIESLPPIPLTLVGHSVGALIVARVLAGLGKRVNRAVLIAGFSSLPPALLEQRAQLAVAIGSGALTLAAAESLAIDLFLGGEGSADDAALIREMVRQSSQARLIRACERIARLSGVAIGRFSTPTLVIHARGDQAVPYDRAAPFAAAGTNTEILTLDGQTHCPQITQAPEIATLVYGS